MRCWWRRPRGARPRRRSFPCSPGCSPRTGAGCRSCTWLGGGVPLSFALCQAQKRVLLGESPDDRLTRRARQQLEELRGRFPWLEPDATTVERGLGGRARWWTFGGLRANATLADHLTSRGCPVISRDNLSLTLDASAGLPDLRSLLPSPAGAAALRPASLAIDALETLKFSFCTPRDLCLAALRLRLADPQGVVAVVAGRI